MIVSTAISQSNYLIKNVNINTTHRIQDLKFIDSTRGIAISHSEIFYTVDAGENWQLKFSIPPSSGLEVINHQNDSIIVTGFYGFSGPSHLSFLFSDSTFQLVNLPNTYNLAYVNPTYFNDSMWSTYGTGNPSTNGLLVIKGANYRRIDTNQCILDIYDDRISYYNGTHLKYSVDSGKSWISISNLPVSGASQSAFQTYYDGNSNLYVHKHGSFLENYHDSTFISNDFGLSWLMLGTAPKPRRLHFVNNQTVVGVDSNLFYYSIDGGFTFNTLQIDSNSTGAAELWVHSTDRFFSWNQNKGLVVIEKNLTTQLDHIQNESFAFSLYPNPAKNSFSIDMETIDIKQVQVFDLTGKIYFESRHKQSQIEVSEFPNGIYFVSIITNNQHSTKRLVVYH